MDNSTRIRNQFLDFFKERGHTTVPSAPIIPANDPTLLFTNAGMNQFKDVFLDQGTRPYTRAVDHQKCIRVSGKHNDLEEVGVSPTHHTFFEMLGNWSFGDYYKKEAIRWAWELITGVWEIDPARLHATVYEGDDQVTPDNEAKDLWLSETSIAKDRVTFHPKKDNFWEMGDVGPCGPCSELHYDMGESFCQEKDVPGHKCVVNGECGRIVELWNLVFIQYRRDNEGVLHPLPQRHIDTGAGFERILLVTENVKSNYETSLFTPLIESIVNISGVPYSAGKSGMPHRVAADHVRVLSFALADGVLPSNDGRGYVMRRILRRGARFGREIGLETPFIHKLVDPLIEIMGDAYPELKERRSHLAGVIKAEEESFSRTLGRGLELFGSVVERIENKKEKVVPGSDAFKLYDTYGFPLDLTQLIARERGLNVDVATFDDLMNAQRVRARADGKFQASGELGTGLSSCFDGYDCEATEAIILAVNKKDKDVEIVLDNTPFYAESGGQESDWGVIESENGKLYVRDVAKAGEIILHRGKWKGGDLPVVGSKVDAKIDHKRRLEIRYNHTATHLLHTALRTHIGSHASQAGSLVAPDRLRFDFTHFEKLSPEIVDTIEQEVNESIRRNFRLSSTEKAYKDAIDGGVVALFGEKYGEFVRIVQIGENDVPYSRELCGGTHVNYTGELGIFRIIYEGAVSAGVRRIEAVTGQYALDLTFSERNALEDIRELLGSHGSDPVEKLTKTLEDKKKIEREFNTLLLDWANNTATDLLVNAIDVNGVKVIAENFAGVEIDRLKMIGDAIRDNNAGATALLSSAVANGSGQLCCVVGDELIQKLKLKAGALVGKAAKIAGGGGGGKPHMATAGAKNPDKLGDAIKAFPEIVSDTIG